MLVLEYKVKAKPSQLRAIDEAVRTVQFIRNKCVRFWMDSSSKDKVNGFALNKYSTQLREEFSFVSDLNSMAVQASAERAWCSISRFYCNCKAKKVGKKGYPRFQKDNRSVEYKTSGWKLHPTGRRIAFTDKKGIGDVKLLGKWDVHLHPIKAIKRVRLVRKADGYYCQFCIDVNNSELLEPTGNAIGLDVGIEHFYTDSNGHHEPNPKFLRKAESSIKRVQRKIYTKKKGSANRIKARKRYAKKHLRVSRQRQEHALKTARCVCQSNDLIVYEDLKVSNMVKNHKLAKAISDVSWRLFREYLEYFASKFGRKVVAVKPHYTSQKCSNCGSTVSKPLSERTHRCSCGCVLQRDHNAAINILNLATRGGHPRSNASGVGTYTLFGETLIEQVLTMNEESPCPQTGECQ
ncbi:RNA-guided endonuclease InsQ/TnpB family protein [Microseira wollei]|uniref:IS891/IS1136/IS1341 transposase n=1 Tax=Microseira wollei NIES-4236 TaxID=2530354 RepID=A0AAV3XQ57_9CYAN|nr:transposase [Microseira wollei]GET43016.1 IS891/IS1136/IS1341 transposase [Microseira wollei NIES-4236]